MSGKKIIAGLNQAVGYQQGANDERTAIVAWLRELFLSSLEERQFAQTLASAIKRGDHLTAIPIEGARL